MERMTATTQPITPRQAAINGLAIVGFISLLVLGIGLAIYSTRYLPNVFSRVNSATVYLSSLFDGAREQLEVVPQTLNFGGDAAPVATTTATTTTEADVTVPVQPQNPTVTNPQPGTETVHTYPAAPAALYGKADLAVTSMTLGYLTSASTDSFVASQTVPENMRPAVRFVVSNVGTNVSGAWYFNADLPTSPSFTYTSDTQLSLRPGERIQYVLGFDRPSSGSDKMITFRVDAGNQVDESNESNNMVIPSLDIN